MIQQHSRNFLRSVGVSLLALSVALPAFSADDGIMAEIVVTAQKRAQDVQDVGIAMQAFSAEQLREFSVRSATDIAAFTPGVATSGNLAGQNTQFTIRGVTQNDFNDIVEAPIAVYLDDGYLAVAQAQTFATLDVERVEIQKGPQGTLFGRNATGGLVQFISVKPSLDGYSGFVDVQGGAFDSPRNPFQITTEGAFGGPVTEDVAARLALKVNRRDNYLINEYPLGAVGGSPGKGAGANMGSDNTFVGRTSFLYRPNDDFTALLSINGTRTQVPTGPYESKATIAQLNSAGQVINAFNLPANSTQNSIAANGSDGGRDTGNTGTFTAAAPRPTPGGDFFGFKPTQPWITSSDFAFQNAGFTDTFGADLKNEWEINKNLTLTAVTDYKKYDKKEFIDVDAGPGNQLSNFAGDDAFSFSQELRLNGTADKINWQTGFYYLLIDNFSTNGLGVPSAGIQIESLAQLRTNSYSAFGQADWNFLDKWTLVGGLRGIDEMKNYHFQQALFSAPNPIKFSQGQPFALVGPNPDGSAYTKSTQSPLWAGKLQLEYRPQDHTLLYAGVNRGVKAGSFNAQLSGGLPVPVSYIAYKPEELLSVEGGIKTSVLDNRAIIDASGYHYNYHNYQGFLFTGVSGIVINRDAETNGAELSIKTSPIKGLDVILGGSYNHARVLDVPIVIGSNIKKTVQPTYAPPYLSSLAAHYSYAAWGGTLSENFSVNYSDGYYYNLRNFAADRYPHYFKENAGISWLEPNGHYDVGFSVENLSNARLPNQGFDLASLCGCNEVSYQLPRFYSLRIHYTY